jgi:hypothetical protein
MEVIPGVEVKSLPVKSATTGERKSVTGATASESKNALDTMSFTFAQLQFVIFVTVETPNQQ